MNLDEAVVIALGGNLAPAGGSLQEALDQALSSLPAAGAQVLARSRWWRSAAWPDPTQPAYLNGIALVRTELGPRALLEALLDTEAGLGRRRGAANAPRTVDLDLIAYGRRVIDEPGLVLPHPRAADRLFVMGPLAEIAPDWRHPVLEKTAAELAAAAKVGRDAHPA
jgi:2-amino-4-hydroxy-6-hydroxymethyldihydropteridine diphosphokinase